MEIFVIGLKRERQRRLLMEYQAKKFGLKFNYIDAVTPQEVDSQHHSRVDWDIARGRNHLRKVEIACSLSHAIAYAEIRRRGLDIAIILEDDAILTPEFAKFVKDGMRPANYSADMMLFAYGEGVVNSSNPKKILSNHSRYTVLDTPACTAGYCLERRALNLLLEKTSRIQTSADWPIDMTSINAELIYPRIVHHPSDPKNTSIGSDRGHKQKDRKDFDHEPFYKRKLLKLFKRKYYLKKLFGKKIPIEKGILPLVDDEDVRSYISAHSGDE